MFSDIRTVICHRMMLSYEGQPIAYPVRRWSIEQTVLMSQDVVKWLEERSSGFTAEDPRRAGYMDLIACLSGVDPVPVPE